MDDFDVAASVWASSVEHVRDMKAGPSFTTSPFSQVEDVGAAFDNDDFDFDTQVQVELGGEEDNDFGDFGEFDDTIQYANSSAFVPTTFEGDGDFSAPANSDWETLRIDQSPSHPGLRSQVEEVLQPLWKLMVSSNYLSDENIRQVGGLNQILVTEESRSLYNALYRVATPNIQPPNWTRSRIRRRHLVSLGIPVNLDEVLPNVNGKPMPALQITTRPSSAPPGPRILNRVTSPPPSSAHSGSRPGSRPSTPKPSAIGRTSTLAQAGLGPKPEIDENRIKQMLAMTSDFLALQPLSTLQAQLSNLKLHTEKISELLAHLLQQRDALQQDSEMYNGLIAELVGEAQKLKSGSKQPKRTGSMRRSSGLS